MTARCDSPDCRKPLLDNGIKRGVYGYAFCKECKRKHSYRVLITQVQHHESITEVILAASIFKTAGGKSAYVGVSFVTMYNWIRKYFDCSFQEFRRAYICKRRGELCYLLDIERSSYSRHDYVLKKIRSKRYCACINALEENLIMTSAPISIVQGILRGKPTIAKISDGKFALVPSPIRFDRTKTPVYFDLMPGAYPQPSRNGQSNEYLDSLLDAPLDILPQRRFESPRQKKKKKKRPRKTVKHRVLCSKAKKDLTFRKRLFVTLHRLGGSADVARLVEHMRTDDGGIPRKNNTRREVYRNPGLLEFDSKDGQIMCLTEAGAEEGNLILDDQSNLQ